jgi:ABC-2 type transport system permease protein
VNFDYRWAWMVIPALLVLIILAASLAILLSAINVYARDTQHLLEIGITVWFWMTPIIYQWRLPADKLREHGYPSGLVLLNPMASISLALQRALYGQHYTHNPMRDPITQKIVDHPLPILPTAGQWWYLRNLGIVGVASVILFVLVMRLFNRLEGNFAEEM